MAAACVAVAAEGTLIIGTLLTFELNVNQVPVGHIFCVCSYMTIFQLLITRKGQLA